MSEVFFEEMDIPTPNYQLVINGLSHGAMTGQMIEQIEEVLLTEQPDYVIVYGDTNSTLAGALVAKKLHIKVVHIEAGLRSFNMKMPEEVNRILTDRLSDILFCPTQVALDNLRKEGYELMECQMVLSGDIMEDAAMYYAKKLQQKSSIIDQLNLRNKDFFLSTFHRAENTDNANRLTAIVSALNQLSQSTTVIVPLPRTAKILVEKKIKVDFKVIEPVGYFDMLQLISNCQLLLTDSGGLQKEAYFFDKYCVTLRDQKEWTELVKHGYSVLAGANTTAILSAVSTFGNKIFQKKAELYGGGTAGVKIFQHLMKYRLDYI